MKRSTRQDQPSKKKRLRGFEKAQFRYFDGSVWNTDWDSRKRKTMPLAIAVQFDFPSRSKASNDRDKRKDQASNSDLAEVGSDQSFGTIDTLLLNNQLRNRNR